MYSRSIIYLNILFKNIYECVLFSYNYYVYVIVIKK